MQTLSQVQAAFECHLSAYCTDRSPANLYEPVRYILGLSGKRVRPLLLATAHLMQKPRLTPQLLDACLAVEMFHNFTLVHDDIMDEAPLRRGQPTVHHKWTIANAILSGDVMLIEVYRLLEQASPDGPLRSVMQAFNRTATHVCEGQQRDMDFEARHDVGWDEYLEMIRGKTACLLGACLEMGGLLGGVGEAEADHLYLVGESLGIGFQLKDDLLDTFGSMATGKQRGGDIQQNKKTALYTLALQNGTSAQREELLHLYAPEPATQANQKIARVTALFEQTGAKAAVEEQVRHFEEKGHSIIRHLNGREEGRTLLFDIIHLLSNRVS